MVGGTAMARIALLACAWLCRFALADVPTNCTVSDVLGDWDFFLGTQNNEKDLNCSISYNYTSVLKVTLSHPNIAVDSFGRKGRWTMVYNQGFELFLSGRVFFAFPRWEHLEGRNSRCWCGQTLDGWVHNEDGTRWGCYKAVISDPERANASKIVVPPSFVNSFLDTNTGKDGWAVEKVDMRSGGRLMLEGTGEREYVRRINEKAHPHWKAVEYPKEIADRIDGIRQQYHKCNRNRPLYANDIQGTYKQAAANGEIDTRDLPKQVDWRDVNGVSYITPVRAQTTCASCFAFSAMALMESRWQLATNKTIQPIFSVQDIVACSNYSQGCQGGFAYLAGGKYGQDFGLVEESCAPYQAKDTECNTTARASCRKFYTGEYYFLGGFYGAGNEQLMMQEVARRGPIVVDFYSYDDMKHYQSGIYRHTGEVPDYVRDNPYGLVNHAVLIVGYGEDDLTGEKYWIVKNSYGAEWGEQGYFRIRKGVNEANIESMPFAAEPDLKRSGF